MRKAFTQPFLSDDKPNLEKLGQNIVGHTGLIFTTVNPHEFANFFNNFQEARIANPGDIANETVVLTAGEDYFSAHSNTIEPYLRTLGLPTRLHNGEIQLLNDYTVCN